MPPPRQDLTSATLAVLFIGGLILATLWIMRPFLPAIIWAVTLVVATWPLMLQVQHHTGNRRGIAVLLMTLALPRLFVVPLWLAISTIVDNMDDIAELVRAVLSLRVPQPPSWLGTIPLIGARATEIWQQFAAVGVRELAPRLTPYAVI
jgi:predicted PurR-regulated permease PerM